MLQGVCLILSLYVDTKICYYPLLFLINENEHFRQVPKRFLSNESQTLFFCVLTGNHIRFCTHAQVHHLMMTNVRI